MNIVSKTKELKEPKFLDSMSILIVDFGQKKNNNVTTHNLQSNEEKQKILIISREWKKYGSLFINLK